MTLLFQCGSGRFNAPPDPFSTHHPNPSTEGFSFSSERSPFNPTPRFSRVREPSKGSNLSHMTSPQRPLLAGKRPFANGRFRPKAVILGNHEKAGASRQRGSSLARLLGAGQYRLARQVNNDGIQAVEASAWLQSNTRNQREAGDLSSWPSRTRVLSATASPTRPRVQKRFRRPVRAPGR